MLRIVVIALLVSCSRDHGAPRVRALPQRDEPPALRGGVAPKSDRIANYKIDARLDVAKHQIAATQTLRWKNTGTSPVTTLPFHLYLNAFKNESSIFMRSGRGEMRGAKATEKWGWIQIDSISIGSVDMTSKLAYPDKPDESVVELPLATPIEPGASVEVHFKFTAQLPEVYARTGFKGEFHMVAQWFPKIGVLVGPPGAERWECRPHHANSEFFADFGTYEVSLTVPNTYVIAATGVLDSVTEAPGGTRTYLYKAEDVHDFAWVADPYLEMMKQDAKVDDGSKVEVRVYYRPEQEDFAKRHLQAGVGAIEKFSAAYVPYPWPIMSIIDPPPDAMRGAGGMEYPTLVTTGGDHALVRKGIRIPEMVTIHEVGHNWFQGILASNEPLEGWLDEGVNEWADAKVMSELYGARSSAIDWMDWHAEIVALRRALRSGRALPSPIATAAFAFVDWETYGAASYDQTMQSLRTLENFVGSAKLAAVMKTYAQRFAFKHPTGRDLFETLQSELGQDLTWFVGPAFHEVGLVQYKLHSAKCRKFHAPRGVFEENGVRKVRGETEAPETGSYICDVVVTNTGVVHVPIEVELRFADGSSQRVRWDDRGHGAWHRFEIERSSKLVAVWIDPDNKVTLSNPTAHHYRLEGNGDASLRAAARFSSITQTLMQVIGL